MSEGVGVLIGGFRVLESLHGGSGAQGVVSKAVCEKPCVPGVDVGEIVALKVMSVADEDGSEFRKLQRRTEVLAGLNHPNVVRYRGCFQIADPYRLQHVVVMELLEGETLKDRLAGDRHGLDCDESLSIITKAVAGLQRSAEAGIVHRDVKPANIFLCRNGAVKIIDFEYAHSDACGISTTGGRFLGTFDYMAPEFTDVNFRGDECSDVFSMGVVLHESLCGRTPYADSRKDTRQADFAFLSRWSDVNTREASLHIMSRAQSSLFGMNDVLIRALSPDRSRRFASFSEFKAALDLVKYREFAHDGRRYRLLRQVGKGGFGEVFKARMMPDDRFVAVKRLLKAAYGDRFRREARIMQSYQDECLTRFIDYFEVVRSGSSESYLVMEFLPNMPGSSLRNAINASAPSRLNPQEVITAFVRYAHGLTVLHAGRVYHRDIKPSNLYFPKGRPNDAVIMDMGIARDAGGSVTYGDVPGTLDYMPPEIVTHGERGDARMDIYALGLCFYEALTGRQGFARLPSGSDGLRAFYERSRDMKAPLFDDGEIVRRPAVLQLLCLMTNPDYSKRLGDACELERRLRALDWSNEQVVPYAKPNAAVTSPSTMPRPRPHRVDAQTRETTDRLNVVQPILSPQVWKWLLRIGLGLVAAVVLSVVWMILENPISNGVNWVRIWQVDRKIAKERADKKKIDELKAVEADFHLRETNAVGCRAECNSVIEAFENALSPVEPDRLYEQWKNNWSCHPLPDKVYDDCLTKVNAARENCVGRQFDRQKVAENEADAVESEYMNANSMEKLEIGDSLAAAWKKKWSKNDITDYVLSRRIKAFDTERANCLVRINNVKNTDNEAIKRLALLARQLDEARTESKTVMAAYADTSVFPSTADKRYADWRLRWNELAKNEVFKTIDAVIRTAQSERQKAERERGVVDECRTLIGNIMTTTTSENVRQWRSFVDRAAIEVVKASRTGQLSERGRKTLEREIAAARKWHVGVIDNKSHETIAFMGCKIPPVTEAPFVFTNGLPSHAAITSAGFEPVRITVEQFDGRTVVVMKADLVPVTGSAYLDVPTLDEGVVCLIDGIMRDSGKMRIPFGQHECLYRNLRETNPGTRDYVEQRQVFSIADGQTIRLAPPGAWVASAEFKNACELAKTAAKSADIVQTVEKGLAVMPIETRLARLEKVFSILHNWQTPSILGSRRLGELNAKYETEHCRVIGRVVNELAVPLRVKVRENWVTVKSGGSEIISYDNGMPADARIAVDGYEYLPLPESAKFEGATFVVTLAKLDPTPVMVTVPNLEHGVTCRIAGNLTKDTVELKPGRYLCAYSRDGYVDQRIAIEVAVGRDMTLPLPKAWVKANVFDRLADTVKDANESADRGIQSAKEALEYR